MNSKLITVFLVLVSLNLTNLQGQSRPSIRKIRNHNHFEGMFDPGNPQSDFLKTQWWLGYKMGGAFTNVKATEAFSTFKQLNPTQEGPVKDYKNFKGITASAGLELTLYHKGFYFSLQPEIRRFGFTFENSFGWVSSADNSRSITQDLTQRQKVDYVTIPFIIKYDLTKGTVKPFVQGGAFYGSMVSSTREIMRETIDNASGASGATRIDEFSLTNKNSFINSLTGLILGAGINADVLKSRIIVDLQYRKALNNITDVNNRFEDDRLNSFGDVMDDLSLTNWSANIGILFPLKYVGSGEYVNKK